MCAWDKSRPSGSTAIKNSDQLLRDNFAGVEEGLVPYDYLRLEVQGSDPTAIASRFLVYSKDVSTKAELYVIDEDSNVIQLTEAGNLRWTAKASTNLKLKLGDASGSNKLSILDSADAEVGSIDSDGNIVGESLAVGTHTYDQVWSQTLADNAALDLGSISSYEGATFLYNGWQTGAAADDGSCLFGTGYNGSTLPIGQTGKVNCSDTINWASPPSSTVYIGRESAGNKLTIQNKTGGTINVRLMRIG